MKKQDEFQVGDEVWDILYGKGRVVALDNSVLEDFPVQVEFSEKIMNQFDDVTMDFTKDGRLNVVANRTLFFSESKVEGSLTRPFVPTLVGKTVVIKSKHANVASRPFLIDRETEDRLLDKHGQYWRKVSIEAIYEVSSDNLLK